MWSYDLSNISIYPIYKTNKFHYGMDFAAPIGTPIYATGNGVVEKIKRSRSKKDYAGFIDRLGDHLKRLDRKNLNYRKLDQ